MMNVLIIEESFTKLYDELDEALKENIDLHQKIKKHEDELKKYRSARRVNADSTNSSLPPSLDVFRQKEDNETKSRKRVGAKAGHPAHLKALVKPYRIINTSVRKAPTGAEKIADSDGKTYYAVQEISCELRTKVTEFRFYVDEVNGTDLPEEIMTKYKISSVTYDSSIKALALYMNNKGAIALDRLTVMLKEISKGKIDIRPSSIVNWTTEFSKLSEQEQQKIAELLLKSEVVNVDETGWRINGT